MLAYCFVAARDWRFSLTSILHVGLRLTIEMAVEVEGGTDERDVREGLWEVPEHTTVETCLLRVQTHVVGIAKHILSHNNFVNCPVHANECLHTSKMTLASWSILGS